MMRSPRIAGGRTHPDPGRAGAWWLEHPRTGIAGVALLATILSCYPVVFFGKSFVSPNNSAVTYLLYPTFPTLPGYQSTEVDNSGGSDLGAMMWQTRSYSAIEGRTLLEHAEFPLWNRYNSSGTPLLGQGISMLGDPLHLIVLSAGGAAWAWDLKFVVAKYLFALGVGLMVFAATRHVGASLLMAFSAVFIGFFAYRFNHPAFFSLCYAPWILYCWLEIAHASSNRSSMRWLCGLVVANWMEIASGTVKEAYMLFVFLNLCGVLIWFFAESDRRIKVKQGFQIACVGALFVLISAPMWLTFLDLLAQSYTSYNAPSVRQISPGLIVGLFDNVFYRELMQFNPSANFFVLLGMVWSLVRFSDLRRERTYLAVGASALISFALAFGLVPPGVIVSVPFLANVTHVGNTFSCILIIHLFVLAGFGLVALEDRLKREGWWRDWMASLLIVGVLLGVFFGASSRVPKSTWFYGYSASLAAAVIVLPLLARMIALGSAASVAAVLAAIVVLVAVHWRHGMHLSTGMTSIDDHVMNPQVRVDLQARSPAVDLIAADRSQPFRVVGLWPTLYSGYQGAIGLESIYGADPLINPYYREFIHASGMEEIWDWQLVVRGETLDRLKPLYDFLNVKYYLGPLPPANSPSGTLDLRVYRSDAVWPRAFFTTRLLRYAIASEFPDLVRKADGTPFAAIQDADRQASPEWDALLGAPAQVVPAGEYRLTPNTTEFTIDAPTKGIVVLHEGYWKDDFEATLNGKAVRYFRVNHAFKGVLVDRPGTYTVRFSYWPDKLTESLWMSGAGIALLTILVIWRSRSARDS
ncbi:MAG: hypothetical protein AB1451_05210 [Nitrospirota bacterium]